MDISTNTKTYFQVKEGSNYMVMMTYDREEIVEYELFLKLAKVLNDQTYQFITINERIVNKSTIIDISPTTLKTNKQKEQIEQRKLKRSLQEATAQRTQKRWQQTMSDYMNKKYGNRWTVTKSTNPDLHLLNEDDEKEIDQILAI